MKKSIVATVISFIMAVTVSAGLVPVYAASETENSETAQEEEAEETPEEKIARLESQVEELLKQVETLEAENAQLKEEVASLSGESAELTPTPEPSAAPGEIIEYTDTISIRAAQEALNAAGYNCGTPDGVAGPQTTQAITSYQTDKGLTVKGTVTNELLDSLGIAEKVQKMVEAESSKNEYSADYTYEQLARNPDSYIGDKIKFTGKVLQYQTDDEFNVARVAMNSDYDTVILVTIANNIIDYRLLEDDIITVYGISFGVQSYEAVSGATITIPWIDANIIEMQ